MVVVGIGDEGHSCVFNVNFFYWCWNNMVVGRFWLRVMHLWFMVWLWYWFWCVIRWLRLVVLWLRLVVLWLRFVVVFGFWCVVGVASGEDVSPVWETGVDAGKDVCAWADHVGGEGELLAEQDEGISVFIKSSLSSSASLLDGLGLVLLILEIIVVPINIVVVVVNVTFVITNSFVVGVNAVEEVVDFIVKVDHGFPDGFESDHELSFFVDSRLVLLLGPDFVPFVEVMDIVLEAIMRDLIIVGWFRVLNGVMLLFVDWSVVSGLWLFVVVFLLGVVVRLLVVVFLLVVWFRRMIRWLWLVVMDGLWLWLVVMDGLWLVVLHWLVVSLSWGVISSEISIVVGIVVK